MVDHAVVDESHQGQVTRRSTPLHWAKQRVRDIVVNGVLPDAERWSAGGESIELRVGQYAAHAARLAERVAVPFQLRDIVYYA